MSGSPKMKLLAWPFTDWNSLKYPHHGEYVKHLVRSRLASTTRDSLKGFIARVAEVTF